MFSNLIGADIFIDSFVFNYFELLFTLGYIVLFPLHTKHATAKSV